MPDISKGLTKKIGPLPVWGYGVAVTGGLLGWKLLSGGGNDDAVMVPTATGAPSDDPSYPSAGAFSALIDRMADLENRGKEQPIPIANPVKPGWGLPTTKPIVKKPTTGGRIQPKAPTKPAIVKPLIPRSSRPTSPPPASAPVRRPISRLPIPAPRPKPVAAMPKPPAKPVATVKKVATKPTIGLVKSAPSRYAATATKAVVTKPKPKPVVRKPAPVARGGARVL